MHIDDDETTAQSMNSAAGTSDSSSQPVEVISVIAERLSVTKRVVDSGSGVRLRKVVHRDLVDVVEPLALENLEVRRVSVNREVEGPIGIRYVGDTTVFSILEERLVIRKQLVLVEEIHVTKVSQTDRTSSQVSLRREEIIIERQDSASGMWSVVDADPLEPKSG